ncbi:MAG TPA: hypothetical protein VIG76_01920 [Amnibacterium sp.]|jgi:hypothetical protein|uniref:hypothetical protein n=1 Tax=Amnibacterium sp. TaxID=1872496 RepID=UPI002F93E5FE
MLEPQAVARAVLIDAVDRLRTAGRGLPAPPLVLDGWASAAALEYEVAAGRLAAGLLQVRAALDEAWAGLAAP